MALAGQGFLKQDESSVGQDSNYCLPLTRTALTLGVWVGPRANLAEKTYSALKLYLLFSTGRHL
jgi:hypothetical protein